jgi:hypothetical protein
MKKASERKKVSHHERQAVTANIKLASPDWEMGFQVGVPEAPIAVTELLHWLKISRTAIVVKARFEGAVKRLAELEKLRQSECWYREGYRELGLEYFRQGIPCPSWRMKLARSIPIGRSPAESF